MSTIDQPTQILAAGRHNDERQPRQAQEHGKREGINVGPDERIVSVAAGSILVLLGLSRGSLPGVLVAGVGGALLYRGYTGHCPACQALDVDTARRELRQDDYEARGIHVEESRTIQKSPEALYRYWRAFDNLPKIMTHLEEVRVIDDRRSHWVAKAPSIAGGQVEWDAEIIRDEPNSVIAWRALAGADVPNSGEVRFVKAPGDRGTEVHAILDYIPPAGQVGRWVAKLFGEEPEQQIREDLRNFKRIMETGEIPTVVGQPRGTCRGSSTRQRQAW